MMAARPCTGCSSGSCCLSRSLPSGPTGGGTPGRPLQTAGGYRQREKSLRRTRRRKKSFLLHSGTERFSRRSPSIKGIPAGRGVLSTRRSLFCTGGGRGTKEPRGGCCDARLPRGGGKGPAWGAQSSSFANAPTSAFVRAVSLCPPGLLSLPPHVYTQLEWRRIILRSLGVSPPLSSPDELSSGKRAGILGTPSRQAQLSTFGS